MTPSQSSGGHERSRGRQGNGLEPFPRLHAPAEPFCMAGFHRVSLLRASDTTAITGSSMVMGSTYRFDSCFIWMLPKNSKHFRPKPRLRRGSDRIMASFFSKIFEDNEGNFGRSSSVPKGNSRENLVLRKVTGGSKSRGKTLVRTLVVLFGDGRT